METNFEDLNQLFCFIKALADDESYVPQKDEYGFLVNPPAVKIQESMHINILGLDNSKLQFKIKEFTPLRRLMTRYSAIIGTPKEILRFRFEGIAVTDNHTPASLELFDGATLEVYQQQMGGCDNQL